MAEDIKVAIASAYEDDEEGVYEVRGRDVATGLPKTAQIKESEIRAAISENVDEMIEAIKLTLKTPSGTCGRRYGTRNSAYRRRCVD